MSLLILCNPQVLSTRILAMKASLCKLSPCTVTLVCDYHAKLFLIAISSTLKSLLRPHILNTPDKSPGDRLTEICAKITDVGGSLPLPAGCPESSCACTVLCGTFLSPTWTLSAGVLPVCQAWGWYLKKVETLARRVGLELEAGVNQRGTNGVRSSSISHAREELQGA